MNSSKTNFIQKLSVVLCIAVGLAPYCLVGAARSGVSAIRNDVDYFVVPGENISRVVIYDSGEVLSNALQNARRFGPFADESRSFLMILDPQIHPLFSKKSWVKMPLKEDNLDRTVEYFLSEYRHLTATPHPLNRQALVSMLSLLKTVKKEACFEEEMIKKILSDDLQKILYPEEFLKAYQMANKQFLDCVERLLKAIESEVKAGKGSTTDYQALVNEIIAANEPRYGLNKYYAIDNVLQAYTQENLGVIIINPKCRDMMRSLLCSYQPLNFRLKNQAAIDTPEQLTAVLKELAAHREETRRPGQVGADPIEAPRVLLPRSSTLPAPASQREVTVTPKLVDVSFVPTGTATATATIAVSAVRSATTAAKKVITAADVVHERRTAYLRVQQPISASPAPTIPTVAVPAPAVAPTIPVTIAAPPATPVPAAVVVPMSRAQQVVSFIRTPAVTVTLVAVACVGLAVALKNNPPRQVAMAMAR